MQRIAAKVLMGATVVIAVLVVVGNLMGPGYVEERTLEAAVYERQTERGAPGSAVSCHDDLYGEIGETIDCTAEAPDGTETRFVARVTAVDDAGVRYTVAPTR